MDYDFEPISFNNLKKDNETTRDLNNKENYINYDLTTRETYRMKRILKIDPLTDKKLEDNKKKDKIFYFYDKWDPLTGERIGTDPIGPLSFNALDLYYYYFKNRYKGLWYAPENNYQGYYGELVGTGKDININSRGSNPEKYLFRLPIIDCYLAEGHNYSLITFGPLLTDDEINTIDNLINGFVKVPLRELKLCYDKSLETNPDLNEINILKNLYPDKSDVDIKEAYNRQFVDMLRFL
jgi:hypothetical protein